MMEYVPHRRIWMRDDVVVTEKWLQERIKDEPQLLGLGEVDVKDVERRQPAAGRLDLLLHDAETSTRYEVELQLGATDESHIIRTIEYWDNERRRYPQYEHVAVIVAEDITARFFNVISLLNGQIPIIAIHVQLLEVGDVRTLVFTRVLDHITLATDEADETAEPADRSYWLNKGSQETLAVADRLVELVNEIDPSLNHNYNRYYVGLARQGVARNFMIMFPRRKHLIAQFRLEQDDARQEELEGLGFDMLPYTTRDGFRMRLTATDLDERADALRRLLADAEAKYRAPGET